MTLERALSADARLGEIFQDCGVLCEYVYDYGHGAPLVGDLSDDWEVTLR